MIVKIWSVDGSQSNHCTEAAKEEGLANSIEYVMDPNKTSMSEHEMNEYLRQMQDHQAGIDAADLAIACESKDTHRVMEYMADRNKIDGRYVSGYRCNPNTAAEEFSIDKDRILMLSGKKPNGGAIAFHIVQSFPGDIQISHEEVHQCGIELCQKIGKHQAIICSHVNPVYDEDGNIHGACPHNHILINAYISPAEWDPQRPKQIKYHDCKESYAQLRRWNDEIAIEHGLPLILNPDEKRVYSWLESESANQGISWKERMRIDIEGAQQSAYNWEQFLRVMGRMGYQVREGKHTTYTSPDGKHHARGSTLGSDYTREAMERLWEQRREQREILLPDFDKDSEPDLMLLIDASKEPLMTAVSLGKQEDKPHYMELNLSSAQRRGWESYFVPEETYEIVSRDMKLLITVKGSEIRKCMRILIEREQYKDYPRDWADMQQMVEQKDQYYFKPGFVNSNQLRHYRTRLYDEDGRKRSLLELIFILACTVLRIEDNIWSGVVPDEELVAEPIYAKTDWKVQNMIDSLIFAREQNLETPLDIELRLREVGAEYSRSNYAVKKVTRAKENMEKVKQAIFRYRETSLLARQILSMEDGKKKDSFVERYQESIDTYLSSRKQLHTYGLSEDGLISEAKITDFEDRYEKICMDLEKLQTEWNENKELYRKLKRLQYNTELAQTEQYCYGPAYTVEKAYDKGMIPETLMERIRGKHDARKKAKEQQKQIEKEVLRSCRYVGRER